MKFSVVVCTANRIDACKRCVESLLSQSLPPDEVVVVYGNDDMEYYKALCSLGQDVRVVWWPAPPAGCCHNFNIGLASAKNEWVAIIDDDAWIPGDWLAAMAGEIAAEPSSTAIYTTKFIERNMDDLETGAAGYEQAGYIGTFVEGASMYYKPAVAEAGFFDPHLVCYGVCRHVAAELMNRGYRIKYVPHICTWHDKEYGFRPSGFSISCHIRNWIIYIVRYYSIQNIILTVLDILRSKSAKAEKEDIKTIDVSWHRLGRFRQSISGARFGTWHMLAGVLRGIANIPWAVKRRKVCRHPDFRTFFGRTQC